MKTSTTDTGIDQELVSRYVRKRDEWAFRELYRRHTPTLYALGLRLCGGREAEAQDVVQDTWIRACRRLAEFRWEAALRTWLCAITVNRARELYRRREPQAPEGATETTAAPQDRPIDRVDLERAITQLPPGYRQVLVLRDIEGYTHEEIGRFLGIHPGTSKSQLSHARRAMRGLLRSEETPDDRKH